MHVVRRTHIVRSLCEHALCTYTTKKIPPMRQKNTPYGAIFHASCLFFDDFIKKIPPMRIIFEDFELKILIFKLKWGNLFLISRPCIMNFQLEIHKISPKWANFGQIEDNFWDFSSIFGEIINFWSNYCRFQILFVDHSSSIFTSN